jgi:hypothetical protein
MSPARRHVRDALLGLLLALAAFAGVVFQPGGTGAGAGEPRAAGTAPAVPRLVCPLHPAPPLEAQAVGSSASFSRPGRGWSKAS